MNWRSFFTYSKNEILATTILLIVIILTVSANVYFSKRNNNRIVIKENDSLVITFQKLQDSLEFISNNQKNTIYKYEGRSANQLHKDKQNSNSYSVKFQYVKQEKFSEYKAISLNECDTLEWKKVPGIGSAFASRIVKYQAKLGGYISVSQLREVYGIDNELYEKILPYIYIDSNYQTKKININKLEFKEILAHPYINFEQTQAIFNLRRRKGKVDSIQELSMLDIFTSNDIQKIKPYITF